MTNQNLNNFINKYVTISYNTPFHIGEQKFYSTHDAYEAGKLSFGEYSDLQDYNGRIEKICSVTNEDVLINGIWVNVRNRKIKES